MEEQDNFEDNNNNTDSGECTQLAEQYPQLDLPQRVEAPPSMDVPVRTETASKNEKILKKYFSPHAHYVASRNTTSVTTAKDKYAKSRQAVLLKSYGEKHSAYHTKLRDLAMRADSCKRSGNTLMEATSIFSMGVIQDNLEDFGKAIEFYKKFASLTKTLGDKTLEALAYNCIGVDYLHLAATVAGHGDCYTGAYNVGGSSSTTSKALMEKAAEFSRLHISVTDEAGQFVGHTNLGLALGSLGKAAEAASHHQEALRLAIELQSTYGQSIAVGNLGLLASRQSDVDTANACMDQHLQLVQSLGDHSAEASAWIQLGFLSSIEKKFEQAARYFNQASTIATSTEEFGVQKQALCYQGIANGNLKMEEHMSNIIKSIS